MSCSHHYYYCYDHCIISSYDLCCIYAFRLIKLCQYEEARKVRSMIQKILPGEEEKFRKKFEKQLDRKRRLVSDDHEQDLLRLDEKLKAIQWDGKRQREKSMLV